MTLPTTIIPSFYVLEIEGTAVKGVIPGDFGIAKISIGSRDFNNDLSAMSALSDTMVNITAAIDLSSDDVKEHVEYNPEFFPSFSVQQKEQEHQEFRTEMTDKEFEDAESGKVVDEQTFVLELSRDFDPLGDFIEARWTVRSEEFMIRGKIAVHPEQYMKQKAHDMSQFSPLQVDNRVHLH